ncbi:MAG: ABC transporter permease [Tannerellaceae bacterium]|nr:ABC transporter permease [Tannerellaceae bacterium]
MKQFYYTLRYLLFGKGNSFIKIVSLSLGLLVAIVLFARVAFEMSFDKFYPENDRLYSIMCLYTIGGESWEPMPIVHAPMLRAFNEEIPEIKYATVTEWPYEKVFLYDNKRYTPTTLVADSLYFKTMGIRVLRGDDRLLGVASTLFLSQTQAKNMFGREDPIGKVLLADNNETYTIQGIFEDIPENCHQRFDAVATFPDRYNPGYWMGRDSFYGYVRLHDNVDPDSIEEKMRTVIRKNRDEDMMAAHGVSARYYLEPVTERHAGDGSVKRMCLILSLLALAILLIASMNLRPYFYLFSGGTG